MAMVCKIIFCPEFPGITDKARRITRIITQAIVKRFAFHAYVMKMNLTCNFKNVMQTQVSQFTEEAFP